MKSDIEYTLEFLEKMKVKLNGKTYSESWFRKHFRGMLNALVDSKREGSGV